MVLVAESKVLADVLKLMTELADDWEYSGEVASDTRLLRDVGLESLDLVVLGTTIQQRYGRLPFSELLAALGERPVEERDLTVGELVAFICEHSSAVGGQAG